MTEWLKKTRADAVAIFKAGLKAVAPDAAVARCCRRDGDMLTIGERSFDLKAYENIVLVGAGKATAAMAAAMETLVGDRLSDGVITVKYGHTAPLRKVRTIEAGHPVPDPNGEKGSAQILALARAAGERDLLLCMISGGGSALLPRAVAGVSLADKQETTRILLACGATIHEINTLRKHLSLIKGGNLAVAAAPATVVSLFLSDVVGDDLDVIASGPTVPDGSTFADCAAIVAKYGLADRLPKAVMDHFAKGLAGDAQETPKPDHPAFGKTAHIIIGNNMAALSAARKEAVRRGYRALILSSSIEGDTCEAAHMHAAIAREVVQTGHPLRPPACILSGGETTVTVRGDGLGGRNQQFALCAAGGIAGDAPVVMLSGGSDGNDGPTDAAGAIIDHTTLDRAVGLDLSLPHYLAKNDAYHFFDRLGDLLITGPTNTNVMDVRIILVPEQPVGPK
jgi:hydroxypyruvate reductase